MLNRLRFSGAVELRFVSDMTMRTLPDAVVSVTLLTSWALNRPRPPTSAQVIVETLPVYDSVVGAGKKVSWVSPATRNHHPVSNS